MGENLTDHDYTDKTANCSTCGDLKPILEFDGFCNCESCSSEYVQPDDFVMVLAELKQVLRIKVRNIGDDYTELSRISKEKIYTVQFLDAIGLFYFEFIDGRVMDFCECELIEIN